MKRMGLYWHVELSIRPAHWVLVAIISCASLSLSFAPALAQEEALWSNWDQVGTLKNPTSDVMLTNGLDGNLTAGVIGSDGAIYMTTENSVTWSRFAPPPGVDRFIPINKKFGFIANSDGRLQFFAAGSDGQLWTQWQVDSNGNWSGPVPLSTSRGSIDDIVVALDQNGAIEVLVLDNFNSHIYRTHQVSANVNFSGNWDVVDRGPGSNLMISLDQTGRLELATVGSQDGRLYVNSQTSPNYGFGTWVAVGSKPPELTTATALTRNQDGRLELFSTSLNNTWHTWQDSTDSWKENVPWSPFGTPENANIPSVDISFGVPMAMRLGNGHLAVFRPTYSGSVLTRSQINLSAGGWTPWADIRLDAIASQGIFPDLTGGKTKDGRASVYTTANLSNSSSDRFVFRITERLPPSQFIPPPGTRAAPSRILEIRSSGTTAPYVNPTCDPSTTKCFPSEDSNRVKDTCANSTWLGGKTKWEWMSMLDTDEQVEKRPIAASGWALQNQSSSADIWFTHPFGFDLTYSLILDEAYSGLSYGSPQDDTDEVTAEAPYYAFPKKLPPIIHVEMDGEFIPSGMQPHEGDRVAVFGKWIADCGHSNYQTEVHPPLVQFSAHVVNNQTTLAHIVGRPFLANQNYGGKSLLDHFEPQIARAALPVPTISQFDAFADAPFAVPFFGTQQFDVVFRPPTKRSDPAQILLVKSWIYTRPGVSATFFSPEDGAVGLHVVLNAQAYVPAMLPPRKTVTITIGQLRNANGSVDEFVPVLDALDATFPLFGAGPFFAPILSRGVQTYEYPNIGDFVPAPQNYVPVSTLIGTSAGTKVDLVWPILGDVTVAWSESIKPRGQLTTLNAGNDGVKRRKKLAPKISDPSE